MIFVGFFHSFVDAVTNSSSEVFWLQTEQTISAIKKLIFDELKKELVLENGKLYEKLDEDNDSQYRQEYPISLLEDEDSWSYDFLIAKSDYNEYEIKKQFIEDYELDKNDLLKFATEKNARSYYFNEKTEQFEKKKVDYTTELSWYLHDKKDRYLSNLLYEKMEEALNESGLPSRLSGYEINTIKKGDIVIASTEENPPYVITHILWKLFPHIEGRHLG